MAIRSSEYFTYDGIQSDTFGILNVNMEGGMLSEPFSSARVIREQKVKGNDRPYFMGIDREPYEFSVSFAFGDRWDETRIGEVAKWLLSPRYYAPLVFADDPDRIFYCLCVDSPELIHNGLREGYIDLHFRCNDPYSYTSVYEEIVDLTSNPVEGTVYVFDNFGQEVCLPEVTIHKNGNGSVEIANTSDGNAMMKFVDLLDNETVIVDCENRLIRSDIPLTSRYANLQGNYLALPINQNHLQIKGACTLKFKYQLKRLQ